MRKNQKNLLLQRFNNLTPIKAENIHGRWFWNCVCICGNLTIRKTSDLLLGKAKTCKQCKIEKAKTHGLSNHPLYDIWSHMLARCENVNNPRYNDYGGRGISVDIEWKNISTFIKDMNNRPSNTHSIERRNNNGNYNKNNCYWATTSEQSNNKRSNKNILYKGITKTIKEWSNTLNIPYMTLYARLTKYNYSIEKAFTKPITSNGK